MFDLDSTIDLDTYPMHQTKSKGRADSIAIQKAESGGVFEYVPDIGSPGHES